MRLTILSGGQTGVDRAALDAALALGIPVGGWCPAGRRAEDGPIPPRYPLRETSSADPAQRTRWNVRDADALLVLVPGPPTGGTALAVVTAETLGRPVLVVDPATDAAGPVLSWLREQGGDLRINVAGPRESECPGVYRASRNWLGALLRALGGP